MKNNYVLWFMRTIAEFGGEYVPYRDFSEPRFHPTGRREMRAELEARRRYIA